MSSNERESSEAEASRHQAPLPTPSPSLLENWKQRIFFPTLVAGIAGGGVGLVSKHRKVHPNISATYATNFAIVAGCYCGAREFARVTRKSDPDDLMNSAIGGFFSGAVLGRLQGGQVGALRYSLIFTIVGTTVDYATLRAKPTLKRFLDRDWFKLPEWSPIQVLDEEALAAKKAREQKLRTVGNLSKEES